MFHRIPYYRGAGLVTCLLVSSRRRCTSPTGHRHHISADDGDKTNSSPGRARNKPLKPLRRNAACSGEPAVTTVCYLHRTRAMGATGTRRFLRPLFFWADDLHNSGASCRENAKPYPPSFRDTHLAWLRCALHIWRIQPSCCCSSPNIATGSMDFGPAPKGASRNDVWVGRRHFSHNCARRTTAAVTPPPSLPWRRTFASARESRTKRRRSH